MGSLVLNAAAMMLPAALRCMGHAVVLWLRLGGAGGYITASTQEIDLRQTYFYESQSPIDFAVLVAKHAVLLTACGIGINVIWVATK